jgi:hypothetical protein
MTQTREGKEATNSEAVGATWREFGCDSESKRLPTVREFFVFPGLREREVQESSHTAVLL